MSVRPAFTPPPWVLLDLALDTVRSCGHHATRELGVREVHSRDIHARDRERLRPVSSVAAPGSAPDVMAVHHVGQIGTRR